MTVFDRTAKTGPQTNTSSIQDRRAGKGQTGSREPGEVGAVGGAEAMGRRREGTAGRREGRDVLEMELSELGSCLHGGKNKTLLPDLCLGFWKENGSVFGKGRKKRESLLGMGRR